MKGRNVLLALPVAALAWLVWDGFTRLNGLAFIIAVGICSYVFYKR